MSQFSAIFVIQCFVSVSAFDPCYRRNEYSVTRFEGFTKVMEALNLC